MAGTGPGILRRTQPGLGMLDRANRKAVVAGHLLASTDHLDKRGPSLFVFWRTAEPVVEHGSPESNTDRSCATESFSDGLILEGLLTAPTAREFAASGESASCCLEGYRA